MARYGDIRYLCGRVVVEGHPLSEDSFLWTLRVDGRDVSEQEMFLGGGVERAARDAISFAVDDGDVDEGLLEAEASGRWKIERI